MGVLLKNIPASSVSGGKNACNKKCRGKSPVPLFMRKRMLQTISSFRFCHIFRPKSVENGVLRIPIFKIL